MFGGEYQKPLTYIFKIDKSEAMKKKSEEIYFKMWLNCLGESVC